MSSPITQVPPRPLSTFSADDDGLGTVQTRYIQGDRPYRIASFDGGGTRAIISTLIMEKIASIVGAEPHQFFDMAIGTSSGGLLVASYFGKEDGKPLLKASELPFFYETSAPVIFHHDYTWVPSSVENLFRPKYQTTGPEKVINLIIRREEMNIAKDVFLPVVLTATDVSGIESDEITPFLFRSVDVGKNGLDHSLYDWRTVLRCTTAAPTYFPPAKVITNDQCYAFMDGGLSLNNPSVAGWLEGMELAGQRKIELLSFGTGNYPSVYSYTEVKNAGIIGIAPKIVDIFFEAMGNNPEVILKGRKGFHRFQVDHLDKSKCALDDVSAMPYLRAETVRWINSHEEYLSSVAHGIHPRDPEEEYALPYEVFA